MKKSSTRFAFLASALITGFLFAAQFCHAQEDPSMEEAHYLTAEGPRWERIAPPDVQPGQGEGLTVAFNKEFIFLGTRPQGLYRYTRKAKAWQLIDSKLPSTFDYGFNPRSIQVSPHSSTTLYAGIELNGVYRSDDSGLTWTNLRNGLSGSGLNSICFAMHPKDPRIIFMGSDNGVYRSGDAGASWAKVEAGLPKTYTGGCTPSANTVCYLPGNPQVMFCVFQNTGIDEESGIYRSLDGGKTWKPCNKGIIRDPKKINGDPDSKPIPNIPVDTMSGRYVTCSPDGKTVYVGTIGGLYRSTDQGDNWIRCGKELGMEYVSAIAVHPKRPNVVFAAADTYRVYGSFDGGKTWRPYCNGLRVGIEKGASGMTMNLNDGGKTFKVTMYRRVDQNLVQYLAFDPYDTKCLYAGCSSGLYRVKLK